MEEEEEQPWLGDGEDARQAQSAFLTFQSTLLGIAGPATSSRGSRKGSKTIGGGAVGGGEGTGRGSPVPGQGTSVPSITADDRRSSVPSSADDRRRTVTFFDSGQQVSGDIATTEEGVGESKDGKGMLTSLPFMSSSSPSSPQQQHHQPQTHLKELSDVTSLPQLSSHKPPPTIRPIDKHQPSSSSASSLSPIQDNKYYNNTNRNSINTSTSATKKSTKKSLSSSGSGTGGGYLPPKRREFTPVQTMDRDEHLPYQCRYKGKRMTCTSITSIWQSGY